MDITGLIPPEIQAELGPSTKLSSEEYEALRADWGNAVQGALEGYDCPICHNRGYMTRVDEMGNLACVECECAPKRRSLNLIRRSGLGDMLARYTLDSYDVVEPWQRTVKDKAKSYLEHPTGWFAALGSVGSGKTHICTVICGELLNTGIEVRYFRWADDSRRLKSLVREPEVYQRELEPYKRCKALYIDDFLKTKRGTEVTAADINLAFELIDYRYSDSRLITILSSEKQMDELLNIDEALGSRIYERTKGHLLKLTGDKNWRTR